MLKITIPETELWDEKTETFVKIEPKELILEHSLESLSEWESKWCKPFYSNKEKTDEENIDYIKCMTINEDVDDFSYLCLTEENIKRIKQYIDAPMTATTFRGENEQKHNRSEVMTNEIIYYYMITLNIPFECQKWHLNRLLTLIRVCTIKSKPPKKMSQSEIMRRNSALNEARRKKFRTNG